MGVTLQRLCRAFGGLILFLRQETLAELNDLDHCGIKLGKHLIILGGGEERGKQEGHLHRSFPNQME